MPKNAEDKTKQKLHICPKGHLIEAIDRIQIPKQETRSLVYYCKVCKRKYLIDDRLKRHKEYITSLGDRLLVISSWESKAGPEIGGYEQISPFIYRAQDDFTTAYIMDYPPVCMKCGGVLGKAKYSKDENEYRGKVCTDCKTIYIRKEEYIKHKELITTINEDILTEGEKTVEANAGQDLLRQNNNKAIDKKENGWIKYNGVTIYVYFKLSNECTKKHIDYVESLTMEVDDSVFKYKKYKVNVYHCKKCDRYYINSEAVEGYVKKKQYPAFRYKFMGRDHCRKEYSELKLLGYNVKKGEFTDAERQALLRWIIENELMSKPEIIRQLKDNIGFSGRKAGMENAVGRWRSDIDFITRYVADNRNNL